MVVHFTAKYSSDAPHRVPIPPQEEAELWVSWGIDGFKHGGGKSKGPFMEKMEDRWRMRRWVDLNFPKMTVRFPPGEPWGKVAMKNPFVPKPPTLVT